MTLAELRGCAAGAKALGGWQHRTKFGMVFDRCPKAFLRDEAPPDTQRLIADQRRLEQLGVLPDAGGWLDQDPRTAEALEALGTEIEFARAWAEQEAAAKAGARG